MNPRCEDCGGACCEDVMVPVSPVLCGPAGRGWLGTRGELVRRDGELHVRLEAPCPELSGGRCGIYSDRPHICRIFPVGGDDCVDVIRRRRVEYYERLRASPTLSDI